MQVQGRQLCENRQFVAERVWAKKGESVHYNSQLFILSITNLNFDHLRNELYILTIVYSRKLYQFKLKLLTAVQWSLYTIGCLCLLFI